MNLSENQKAARLAMAQMNPDFSQMPESPPLATPQTQPGDFAAMPSNVGEPDFSQIPEHPPEPQQAPPPVQDPNSPMPGAGLAQQEYANGGAPDPTHMPPTPDNLGDLSSFNSKVGQDRLSTAAAEQQNSVDLNAQAQGARAEASRGAYHQQTIDAQARQQYLEVHAAETQKRSEEVLQKYQQTVDEQAKMLSVHPQGIWQKSGVNPVAGSIALLLGAANKGTQNSAMDAINHRVDANIADQKRQFEQLGQVASGYNNTFAMLHTQFGDETATVNAMKQLSGDSIKAMIDEAANATANPQIKADAAKAKADIDAKLAQDKNTFDKTVFEQQSKAVEHKLKLSEIGNTADKNNIDREDNYLQHQDRVSGQLTDLEKASLTAKGKQGLGFQGIPGSERLDSGTKAKIGERIAGGEKVNNAINGILGNKRKGILTRLLDNPQYEAQLESALRQSEGLSSRISGPEGDLLRRMAGYASHGTLGKFLPSIDEKAFVSAMEKLRDDQNGDVRAELHTYGLEPNSDSYLYDDPKRKDYKSFAQQALKDLPAN